MRRSMRRFPRIAATASLSVVLATALAACGEAGGGDDEDEGGGGGEQSGIIGLLLPDDVTTRYETFDRTFFEDKVSELCPGCEVRYNNASNDSNQQKQQFDALLAAGAE